MRRKLNTQLTHKNGLLSYLLLLTTFFIFLEISVFVQGSEIYLGDYKLVANRLSIPAHVVPGIVYFISMQLLLHLVFVSVIWATAIFSASVLQLRNSATEKLGLVLWFCAIFWVLAANQHFFPNSKFAHISQLLIWTKSEVIFLILIGTLLLSFIILALIGAFARLPKFMLSLSLMTLALILIHNYWPKPIITDASSVEKPNIILIGIDSLRPDFLGYNGYTKHTPHLDQFLNQSTVFAEAMTPLARTFPAWVSILSGEYPKHTGVRFNLPTLESRSWDQSLPSILHNQGYETVFSTDETRFSNIDETYGFDKTLTPPIGFNDFLLGNLNDFPLANLIVNMPLGKYFFPHSYGNRPVFITYNPNTYLDFIKPALMQPRTKPLFFAIHFCLPHFPYFWGRQDADDKSIHNYQASIRRVDQQFQDFMQILQESQVLNHALIFILSDHGEALELSGDRVTEAELFVSDKSSQKVPHFFPQAFDFETINQSAGHGTDVLGLTQYHIVLAFRTFGMPKTNQIRDVMAQVSLLDIKPTILDFLELDFKNLTDGKSLKPYIFNSEIPLSQPNHFFYESDFSPQAVRSVHPETRKLLFEGIDYFQVDHATGRISVKKSMEQLILSSKQFADLYGEWVLALYPQTKTQMMPILVNLHSGRWTNDLNSKFALNSPAASMLRSMRAFYGEDITQIARNYSRPI